MPEFAAMNLLRGISGLFFWTSIIGVAIIVAPLVWLWNYVFSAPWFVPVGALAFCALIHFGSRAVARARGEKLEPWWPSSRR